MSAVCIQSRFSFHQHITMAQDPCLFGCQFPRVHLEPQMALRCNPGSEADIHTTSGGVADAWTDMRAGHGHGKEYCRIVLHLQSLDRVVAV